MYHYVFCNSKYSRYQSKHCPAFPGKHPQRLSNEMAFLATCIYPTVLNVVSRLLLRSKSTCQNPDVASFMVKYLDCVSSGKMSSRVLAYHWFLLIALFKSFGSRHSLRLLSSLITGTIELVLSVCSCTSVMMSSLTSLTLPCKQTAFAMALTWVDAGLVCKSLLTSCGMVHLVEFQHLSRHLHTHVICIPLW